MFVMEHSPTNSTVNRIGFIGNYLPRQCGIATFTADLCEAIATEYGDTTCIALPVNDVEAGYAYPTRVRFELTEKDIESYLRAADFLHTNNVDLVCLQHEYGIFGGRAGSHILALLRELRMPIVTTLHTILRDPDPDQRRVLEEVASLSDRLVVMSELGGKFLREIYGVPAEKIDLIPHGIPDVPFVKTRVHKGHIGNAVWNQVNFLRWHSIDLAQELAAKLAHDHQPIGQAGDFFQDPALVGIWIAQNRVQGGDYRHAQLTQEGQNVTAGSSAKNAIFVLQAHEVYVVDVQKVGRAAIGVNVFFG